MQPLALAESGVAKVKSRPFKEGREAGGKIGKIAEGPLRGNRHFYYFYGFNLDRARAKPLEKKARKCFRLSGRVFLDIKKEKEQ
jgi:hypothetical protein